ncbi:MAG: UDP-N-acetylmuramoyl-L-alanyl-D-glutamate--2,6-diaminopimelate ligase [Alphaproteobacteria bacterium]|nr:MAG: UDP-N-acetylmuramoyl-L-alanyl-D-glutamate--2,6-diaminopimelate ligase [Alphaproteobacteria bacterium]
MKFWELINRSNFLKDNFKNIEDHFKEIEINGISNNSKNIKKKFIFFAFTGNKTNGNLYINEARRNGASIVISQEEKGKDVIELTNKDYLKIYSHLCSSFYNKKPRNIIAVTGTNGKTSVTDFCRQIWSFYGLKSASIGTLGIKDTSEQYYHKIRNNLTTLDSSELNKHLSKLYDKQISYVALEASSHGINQNRLDGINFNGAVFTNLSHDHLDYHKNMKNYFSAKMKLFTEHLKDGTCVSINLDDKYGMELYNKIKTKNFKFVNFGFNEKCELKLLQIKKIEKIWQLEILYKNKLYKTDIGLVGHFQIYNALAAASICLGLGLKQDSIFKSLSYLQTVPGRMQIVNHPLCKATIIVDYAHTPNALENAILAVKKMNFSGKIYTLFGCGGERDHEKRSKMGEVAFKNSDFTIITDDNPRTEDPSLIRKSIINNNPIAIEIPGRDVAIKKAISFLKDDDILIIAGKGHEQTQTIGIETLPFDDVSVVKNTLDRLNP